MDENIFKQLLELTFLFKQIGIKPLICGGLGIYLRFCNQKSELPLRTTNDIDLMLTKTQLLERNNRDFIAQVITVKLAYIVCEEGKYFQFQKGAQRLDILSQPVEGLDVKDFRAVLVKSKLHGHITPEAAFIEEDLKTIPLSRIIPGEKTAEGLEVFVPSLTNHLILKLFAFDDRNKGTRKDESQAQVHAYDIYMITALADLDDYREGRRFLSRHNDSNIIQKAKSIVVSGFSSIEQPGWRHVIGAAGFFPGDSVQKKRERLDKVKNRLVRWFN